MLINIFKILKTNVAIKKMLKPFASPTHAKRTYRELKLLTDLNHESAEVRIQLYLLSNFYIKIIGCSIVQRVYTRQNFAKF